MRMIISLTLAGLFLSTFLGCNTFKGVGKDVENAGKGVQKVVEHND